MLRARTTWELWSGKPGPALQEAVGTGDTPINTTDLSQERGADAQVLGDHVQAEEVPVDASPCHGEAVHVLVLL